MIAAALVLALSGPVFAEIHPGCCSESVDPPATATDAGQSTAGERTCPYAQCHRGARSRKVLVGVRGGAVMEASRGPAYTTLGFQVRSQGRCCPGSAGIVLDRTSLAGRNDLYSVGATYRVRFLPLFHGSGLYAEAGPTLRQSFATPNVEGQTVNSSVGWGYTAALGVSAYAGEGVSVDVAYVLDSPFHRDASAGAIGTRTIGSRLGIGMTF